MGAANTLRWVDHPELRRRMDELVDGIADCRQPNGYIMAYPEGSIFHSERAAYTRSWVTHGLIEAGYTGNPKAFGLLRGYYDWYDSCPYLPKLLRGAAQGVQGMIANTRMSFTPAANLRTCRLCSAISRRITGSRDWPGVRNSWCGSTRTIARTVI